MKTIRSGLGKKNRLSNSREQIIKSLHTTGHGCACCALLVLAFVLGVAMNGTSAFAAVDKNQGDINFLGAGTQPQYVYYADVSDGDKVKLWVTRLYHASFEAAPALNHNAKEGGGFLQHKHHQVEYSAGVGVTQADADKYWNERFIMADKIESASVQHQTGYEWALTKTDNATGTYTYQLAQGDIAGAFNDALTDRGTESDEVEADDLLLYFASATYVVSTRSDGSGGNEPKKIKWKWRTGGVYEYTTPSSNYEFNTPYCMGEPEFGTSVEYQGWTEDLGYLTSPRVMGP